MFVCLYLNTAPITSLILCALHLTVLAAITIVGTTAVTVVHPGPVLIHSRETVASSIAATLCGRHRQATSNTPYLYSHTCS